MIDGSSSRKDEDEAPGWGGRLLLAVLSRLPRALASRAFGRLADLRIPLGLRALLIGIFARLVRARPGEAAQPLRSYPTLNAFFVRRLKPGARRWPGDEAVLASPVDGVLTRWGRVEAGCLLQAKGRSYRAAALLGSEAAGARFQGALYATIYLAPRHYHRIHAPLAGRLHAAAYLPGGLFPVNAAAVARIPDLFVTNERVVCFLEPEQRGFEGSATGSREMALVAVGAYNVGRISTAFDPGWGGGESGWVTNRQPPAQPERRYRPPLHIRRGDELMAFHLGSSVIVMLDGSGYEWVSGLVPGQELRLGDPLARPRRMDSG